MRRATHLKQQPHRQLADFYPRSPCGERQTSLVVIGTNCIISIHALLAESDHSWHPKPGRNLDFYPRSPCGERQTSLVVIGTNCVISIHALLAESDIRSCGKTRLLLPFLSTLSLRRATFQGPGFIRHGVDFYPRSPCGERPSPSISMRPIREYFYPRSPCGERQGGLWMDGQWTKFLSTLSLRRATSLPPSATSCQVFLSTLSLRRATVRKNLKCPYLPISIHALLAESDVTTPAGTGSARDFYPRSPCGERRSGHPDTHRYDAISIHALLAESDSKSAQNSGALLRI